MKARKRKRKSASAPKLSNYKHYDSWSIAWEKWYKAKCRSKSARLKRNMRKA